METRSSLISCGQSISATEWDRTEESTSYFSRPVRTTISPANSVRSFLSRQVAATLHLKASFSGGLFIWCGISVMRDGKLCADAVALRGSRRSRCAKFEEVGRVAQVVEQRPVKAWVAGSNPAALTKNQSDFVELHCGVVPTSARLVFRLDTRSNRLRAQRGRRNC